VRERLDIGNCMLRIGLADADDSATLWGHLWRFDAFLQLGEVATPRLNCPASTGWHSGCDHRWPRGTLSVRGR
jgi:hypothetical protein